jgi:tetratricopeptide (TPR) repeat protein
MNRENSLHRSPTTSSTSCSRSDLAASGPANVQTRRDLASGHIILGDVLAGAHKREEAIAEYRKGLEITHALYRSDPRNKLYQRDLYLASGFLSIALAASGREQDAAVQMQRALELAGALADQPQASQDDHRNYAWLLLEARGLELKSPVRARLHAEKAAAMTDARNPAVLHTLALAYQATGELAQAIRTEEKALALVPPVRDGLCVPHLWRELDRTLAQFKAGSASGAVQAKQ